MTRLALIVLASSLLALTGEALSAGTPISCGSDRVHLHTVQGRTVVVTLFSGGEVARAIQVVEPSPASFGD